MPTYIYRRGNGEAVELSMSYAEKCRLEKDGKIVHDGETLVRDICAEHSNVVPGCSGWPIWSDAAAIHPSLVPQVSDQLRSKGVLCEFDKTGRPKFDSAAHRRTALRAMNMHDSNSYV
jgi:hypothetical protein